MVDNIDEKYLKLEEAKEIAKYRIIGKYIEVATESGMVASMVYIVLDFALHLSPFYHPLIAFPYALASGLISFRLRIPNAEEIFLQTLKEKGYVRSSLE